jgi:DNA-directed RNA polymerase subunit RPC12/RpoP
MKVKPIRCPECGRRIAENPDNHAFSCAWEPWEEREQGKWIEAGQESWECACVMPGVPSECRAGNAHMFSDKTMKPHPKGCRECKYCGQRRPTMKPQRDKDSDDE